MNSFNHSKEFDDIYFSADNGLEEKKYVFLKQNNLPTDWQNKSDYVIAETGFGTGLSFLLTWILFEETSFPHQHLTYYSFEKFPLSPSQIQTCLQKWSGEFKGKLDTLLAAYPLRIGGWHHIVLSPQVTLVLIFDDVNRALPELDTTVNCWFLDGHAPAKNPDMWSEVVFQNMSRLSITGTRLSTYTAATHIRNSLTNHGFTISKAKGYGQKKDMSIGIFEKPSSPLPPQSKIKNIAIIGGGIAGATLAHSLKNRNVHVTLFEKKSIAAGGSGNSIGLCNPRMTFAREFEADFYSSGFALANHLFKKISKANDIGYLPCGSLHILEDEAKRKRMIGFTKNWGWHSDHVQILIPDETSKISGMHLPLETLFLPDAGMVSPKKLTELLAQSADYIQEDVLEIKQVGIGWIINHRQFDAVILANGYDCLKFKQAAHLPLQKIRGQITEISFSPYSNYSKLRTNLCYGGYASHSNKGSAVIGSTFQHWIDDDALRTEDDIDNLNKLKTLFPSLADGIQIKGSRASFRCAAKDRHPVIGQMDNFENLYISTGLGSHGIITSLIGAEFLAAKICCEHQILPRNVMTSLSPNRFKRKA